MKTKAILDFKLYKRYSDLDKSLKKELGFIVNLEWITAPELYREFHSQVVVNLLEKA